MIKLADIPVAWKMGTGGLAVVLAVMAYLTTYETRADAQAYQLGHASELVRARVSEIERVIADKNYRLLSERLSEEQRAFLEKEVARLEAEKQCIIDRKC